LSNPSDKNIEMSRINTTPQDKGAGVVRLITWGHRSDALVSYALVAYMVLMGGVLVYTSERLHLIGN
jgi:hypothetical protein